MSSAVFEFGPFQLDGAKRALYRNGDYFAVTPKALEILLVLVEDAGHIVTRETLLERVWPDAFVEEGSISNNISSLRKVLNPHFDGDGPIATVARRGYRFTAPVRIRDEAAEAASIPPPAPAASLREAPDPADTPPPTEVQPEPTRAAPLRALRSRYSVGAVVAAVLVVAVAAIARSAMRAAPQPPATRRSVAVLTMKNLSGQPDQAWLSTALTETIGAELMAGGQIRLVAAENVARIQAELSPPRGIGLTRKQLDEIGRDLGCDLILTGDYLAVGSQIRVDVRLDAVTTGEPVATSSVTDEARNLLQLVGRAGGDLRARLGLSLPGSSDLAAVRAAFPSAPEATRSYFQGLDALRLRDGPRAATLFQQAIAVEPQFALAHSALSTTWRLLGYDRRGAEEAKLAVAASARLSPEDRQSIQAQYSEASFDWPRAIEGYRALWKAYPDNIEYGLKLANAQHVGGHSKDAQHVIEEMRRMPAPDGTDPRIDLVEATVAERAGDFRRALAAASRAAERASALKATPLLARARLKEGTHLVRLNEPDQGLARMAEAGRLFESLGDAGGVADALRWQGATQVDRGQNLEGDRLLTEALALSAPLHYVRLTSEIEMYRSVAARQRGALTAATTAAEAAITSAREADDASALARATMQLGVALKTRGEYARARSLYEEAASALKRLGDATNAESAANNIAVIDLAQGRAADARTQLERLLEGARKSGSRARIANRLLNLSTARALQGDLVEAEAMVAEECAAYEAIGARVFLSSCRGRRGLLLIDLGRVGDARTEIGGIDAADLAVSAQPPTDLARLATLYLLTGDRPRSASTLAAADRLLSGREYIPEQAMTVAIARGKLEAASGQMAAALARFAKTRSDAEKFGLMPLALECRLEMAKLTGEPDRRKAFAELQRDAKEAGLGIVAQRINANLIARGTH